MPLNISLKSFIDISAGKYNAGQVDFVQGRHGAKLVKVNNHVFMTDSNRVVIDKDRVIQIKEAFLNSILGKVSPEVRKEIAEKLGMGDIDMTKSGASLDKAMQRRFEPLRRQQLREIIVQYGLSDEVKPREDSKDIVARREAVNRELASKSVAVDNDQADVLNILTLNAPLDKVLDKLLSRRGLKEAEANGYAKQEQVNAFAKEVAALFKAAVSLIPDNGPDSVTLTMFNQELNVTRNRETKMFSVRLGKDGTAFSVNLALSAKHISEFLQMEIVKNKDKAFTGDMTGSLLDLHFSTDIMNGIIASDRTSETRRFAAKIIAAKMADNPADKVMNANINTNFLVMLAKEVLDGKIPDLDLDALNQRFEELKQEMGAGLDNETVLMLALVTHLPLEHPENGNVELVVSSDMLNQQGPMQGIHKPITNNIQNVANRALPDSLVKHLNAAGGASKPEDVRNFVADMMFSDNTLMSDVNLDLPGEHFRKYLLSARNMDAFRDIMVNRAILDTAVAPTLADAAKTCFGEMFKLIDAAYQAKYGKSIAQADTASAQFKLDFANLINEIDGVTMARCDNLILQFANNGTERIQAFINDVFKLNVPADDNGQALRSQEDAISRPYEGKSAKEVRDIVRSKSLNDLIDNSSRDTVPGQIGLFKVGLSTYFQDMTINDKRAMLAASLRYAATYDFSGVDEDKLDSARQAKTSQFCGAILKGTGPILQKMMQGLPRTMLGGFADALEDMKCNLPPINRKIVQAHFAKILKDNPDIKSISFKKSLGAATVGEALLCEVKYQDGDKLVTKDVVFKIMRHDAIERTKREAKIFDAAARKLGVGMEKTWQGQYAKILEELDFRNEARNIEAGQVYDKNINKHGVRKYHAMYRAVKYPRAMKLFGNIPADKNIMALEVAPGITTDRYIREFRKETEDFLKPVCKTDPATGHILWEKDMPIFRDDVNFLTFCRALATSNIHNTQIQIGQQAIMAAATTWFEEAIVGNGIYHGDMHAGNIMLSNEGVVTFIDFGNITALGKRPGGIDERKCLLKMILGSMIRMPSLFMQGFKDLLSEEGRGEYSRREDVAKAIIEEVMKKGQFSYDMCYRLQAGVNELQKLGLEMPPQINGFIQSMTRLQNILAETNTIALQNKKIMDCIVGGKLPIAHQYDNPHELDLLGNAVNYFFNDPKAHIKVRKRNNSSWTNFEQRLDYLRHDERFAKKYTDGVMRYCASAQTAEQFRNVSNTLISECLEKHLLSVGEGVDTDFVERYKLSVERLRAMLDARLSDEDLDLDKLKHDFALQLLSISADLLFVISTAMNSDVLYSFAPPGTFANVLTNIMFSSGDSADAIMSQLAEDQFSVGMHISGLSEELNFETHFFNPRATLNNFVSALLHDLEKNGSDDSYKVHRELQGDA